MVVNRRRLDRAHSLQVLLEGLFKKPVIVKVGSLAHCFGFEEGCNYLSRIGITCFIVFHKLFKAKDRKWF